MGTEQLEVACFGEDDFVSVSDLSTISTA